MAINRTRSVTMTDVATRSGVSRTTVSFVLSNRENANIPDSTRQRVLEAVDALGYRPNAGAQALAAQKSDWYGLITEIVTAPFAVDIIKGVQDKAWDERKFVLIASSEGDPAMETAAIEKLLEQRVEGLIYATTWHRSVTLPPAALEVPTVLINCFDPDDRFACVVPDEEMGGYRAAKRLLDAGHSRVAFINLDPAMPAAVGRRAGFDRAHAEAGITVDPDLMVYGHAQADGGYDAAAALLDSPAPPTAFFCGNDRMAMGAYDAIKERGLRIPQDIAVVGFDNQEIISQFLRPRLTTVALPFEQMGAVGVTMLADLIAGAPLRTNRMLIDCPLLERASV